MTADPSQVFETATAFWRSGVMFAACELGLFDALEESPCALPELVGTLKASERGLKGLLDACVSQGFVTRTDGLYANTETASKYLVSKGDESLVVTLGLQAATYPMWAGLGEAVKTGKPVIPPGDLLGGDPELTRRFAVGMHQRARGVAKVLAERIDLSGKDLLADIGGGPGTYSVLLVKRYPKLRARVMDLPPILEVARGLIDASGVGDRIETVGYDVASDNLGKGFDAALISGLLHRMTPSAAVDLLREVYECLPAGGLVAVNDLFTAEGGPQMAVLFGLQMLLTNETGGAHGLSDVISWLGDAGFHDMRSVTLPPPLPHTLVTARKNGT